VGGWSGCSLLLVGFCRLWAVVLCVIVVICGQLGICLDGGQFMSFMGSCAHFVWWVVMVCGSLGWTSHIVSGSAVVVHGQSYSFHVLVGGGHGWVCSLSFVDFDRGQLWSFMGSVATFFYWLIFCFVYTERSSHSSFTFLELPCRQEGDLGSKKRSLRNTKVWLRYLTGFEK